MTTPTRLANKTQWALQDTLAIVSNAEKIAAEAQELAEKRLDPAMALRLSKVRLQLAKIERIQRAALKGEYEERNREQ